MTDIEPNILWSNSQGRVKDGTAFGNDYNDSLGLEKQEVNEDYEKIPMIVVESSQQSEHTDAPIVIYPNDPSVVGAEEVVVEEEEQNEIQWTMHPVAKEEVVVPSTSEYTEEPKPLYREDFADIPLNDESYATYHPFPCDFCCRRFKKKANLINHMVAHQTQRPHSCGVCSSRFMRKCDLVNHQKIHAYVPNRVNRDDLEEDPGYICATQRKVSRRRNSSTAAKSSALKRSSPDENRCFKPSSSVDEDVKLLLDLTSKLNESRRSELYSSGPSNEVEEARSGVEGKPYVCTICNRCFARESALVSHSQVHAEDSSHDCAKCGSRFFTLELLRDHYSKKHDMIYDGETSDSGEERGADKGWYTGDERFGSFQCSICSVSFSKMELLRQHKRMHVKSDDFNGLYRCQICQSMFMTNDKLLEHLDVSVNCQRNVCLLCGDSFSDQSLVADHIKDKHGRDVPPHTCSFCGKQCRDPKTLKRHYWVHISVKRYTCKRNDCGKRFNTWGRLRRHMAAHNSSKTSSCFCTECDEEFPDRRALSNHRHTHLPRSGSNQRRFVCNECGKCFGSRSSQQIHNRIHTGERPYGCRYCWKAFADGGTLRKHERIHTGEKPYVCAVCPRAFNQRVVLREHIRSHHTGSTNKIGFSTPVYMCPVCGIITGGSDELALHIVKHSDDNTVRNRAAPTTTRPVKRRSKPDPSSDYYRVSEFDEADFFDNRNSDTESIGSASDKKSSPTQSPSKRSTRSRRTSTLAKFSKYSDAASLREQSVRKAKMINSTLPSSSTKAKKGVKKRGRRGTESNRAVVTVIKPRVRTLSGRSSGRKDSLSETVDDSASEKQSPEQQPQESEVPKRFGRPRTKNVSYETMRALNEGLPAATFPEVKKEKAEAESAGEGSEITEKQEEVIEESVNDLYSCGICSVIFNSKADLLFHVPVHI